MRLTKRKTPPPMLLTPFLCIRGSVRSLVPAGSYMRSVTRPFSSYWESVWQTPVSSEWEKKQRLVSALQLWIGPRDIYLLIFSGWFLLGPGRVDREPLWTGELLFRFVLVWLLPGLDVGLRSSFCVSRAPRRTWYLNNSCFIQPSDLCFNWQWPWTVLTRPEVGNL